MLTKAAIIKLILYYSTINGVDGKVVLSVAQTESNLNPNAVGLATEVGLFQIKPAYSKYTRAQLFNPETNIKEGIRMLKEAKATCVHKEKHQWLVCYNYGKANAKRVRHPALFPYVLKVEKNITSIK